MPGTPVTLIDETGIERFRGTQVGSGGSPPVQATYSQNSPTSIPDGSSVELNFTTLDTGTDLLDRTATAEPTFLASGVYAVSVTVAGSTLTPGGYVIASLGGDAFNASEYSEHPEGDLTVAATAIASAGDTLLVHVLNHDGAATRDFLITSATVVLLPGTVGAQGAQGAQGARGAQGTPGVGVPAGGSAGTVLTKASGANYDTLWAADGGGGGGGLQDADFTFTEVANGGVYTAAMPLPAGTLLADVLLLAPTGWAADTAIFDVGDNDDPQACYSGVDFKSDMSGGYTPGQAGSLGSSYALTGWDSGNQAQGGMFPVNGGNSGSGLFYDADNLLTMTMTTTNALPVVPTGVLRVKVIYFAPVTAVAASFA